MTQPDLEFDLPQALAAKKDGMKRAAEDQESFFKEARKVAKRISRRKGWVQCDDVRAECELLPRNSNAWGVIFNTENFVWTGEFRRSKLKQGHGNLQKVWRWVPTISGLCS